MIRVLHVGLSSNPGGVENFVINYHKHIHLDEFTFDYLDMYGDGLAFSDTIKSLGGKVISIANYKRHPLAAMRGIKKILDKNDYDIVHVHMQSTANLIPILVALAHKKEVVIAHSHSSSTPKGIVRKVLNSINTKWLRNTKVQKWACGHRAGQWMWGSQFRDEDIIPNAIDYDKYRYNEPMRIKLREKYGFDADDFVVGFVGRFGSEKNVFFLIKVLKELKKYSSHYKLLTVGGNELYDEFLDCVKKEGLTGSYFSAGIQSAACPWYQVMDAFLLPSFFEGFPMVGVEAQASGLKCFFSDRISNEIDLCHNASFLPIGDGDEKIWAKTIDEKLENGRRVPDEFPSEFRIEIGAKLLEDRYRDLLPQ